jgi:hypothetical protein
MLPFQACMALPVIQLFDFELLKEDISFRCGSFEDELEERKSRSEAPIQQIVDELIAEISEEKRLMAELTG